VRWATGPAAPFTGCRSILVTGSDDSEWQVLAGKTADDNDRLSTSEGRSHEPWMHAAGVPGSHVVVRKADAGSGRAANPVPDDVLRVAARIAAFYSKAKGSRVKVHVTTCGKVGKASGAPAGQVLLRGDFKTLMVAPLDPADLKTETQQDVTKARPQRSSKDNQISGRGDWKKQRWELRTLQNLERKMERLESAIEGIDEELQKHASDWHKLTELQDKRQAEAAKLDSLYEQWTEASESS